MALSSCLLTQTSSEVDFVSHVHGKEKEHTHSQPHTHPHTYTCVHIPTSTSCVLQASSLFMCVMCMCALVTPRFSASL